MRSSVGANPPRRSTSSSSASATRVASTSATATTSAGWSSTSSRGTTARSARSSRAGSPRSGSTGCGSRAEARDVHEPLRQLARRGRRFYKAPLEAVAVVHDDVDLEHGRLQLRLGGGLAGHNGLRSIKQAFGSADFLRARVGVGRPGAATRPVADYVLSPFAAEDDADALVSRAADAVETLARDGLDEAQRRFN